MFTEKDNASLIVIDEFAMLNGTLFSDLLALSDTGLTNKTFLYRQGLTDARCGIIDKSDNS